MHQVPGVFEPIVIGSGKPAPGHNYDSLWFIGWYDAGNVQANAVFGLWNSIDDPNHGNSGTCTDGTWTKRSDGYPNGWDVTNPSDISGDPYVYGEVYLSTPAGAFLGMFN